MEFGRKKQTMYACSTLVPYGTLTGLWVFDLCLLDPKKLPKKRPKL